MDFKVKKLPKSEVEITVTVSDEKMQEYRDKACEYISKEIKVKGFRPGKAPYNVLKEQVGESAIEQEAQQLAIQNSYADAVMKENIQVIARPKIAVNEKKEGSFSFTATVAVLPEVILKDYKSIKVKAQSTEADEKEINGTIDQLRRLHQVAKEIDGPAKKGDRVEIDFEGFDENGVALENTKSKNHPVVIGDNTMVPGFEDALIGLKKGDSKEFDVVFPKDYHYKPFQKKRVKFKVECKMVEEMNTPDLSEELIEKIVGKKQKVEEFKEEVKNNIEARKKQDEVQRQEAAFIEELIKKAQIDMPESLLNDEIEYMLHEFRHELENYRKIPFEQFLAQNNKTEEDLRKEYKPEAEKRIKARLSINKVLEEEGIEVSDKELDDEIEKMITSYPAKEQYEAKKELKKKESASKLKNRIKLQRLFEGFLPAFAEAKTTK